MGAPMARHLKDAGAEVLAWNRSEAPLAAAKRDGLSRVNHLPEIPKKVGAGIISVSI